MSTPAERMRRYRARYVEKGIETVTLLVPSHHAAPLRELARHLRENPQHTFLPAVRLANGRLKFLKE